MSELQPNVYAGICIPWGLACICMVGRAVARRMTKMRWGCEDYFCLSAFIFASFCNTTSIYWCARWYMGRKIPDTFSDAQREEILMNSRRLAFFNSLTYAFSIAWSKLAILSLYWRLFKLSSIRIPIIVLFVIVSFWATLRLFLVVFRCWPVAAYWDHSIPGSTCHIKDSAFFFGTMLPHFLMDVVILILPVVEVFKLRLRLGQKIGIAALFLVGIIVCVASISGLVLAIPDDPHSTQMPYEYAISFTWGSVEVNMAVVSSCFPLLRPIFRSIVGSRVLSSYPYTTHGLSTTRRDFPRMNGIEMSTMSKKRKKGADSASSQQGLADEERGILGDVSTGVKSPDRVYTTITRPQTGSEWFERHEESGIRVRNDVVIEVHEVNRARSLSS